MTGSSLATAWNTAAGAGSAWIRPLQIEQNMLIEPHWMNALSPLCMLRYTRIPANITAKTLPNTVRTICHDVRPVVELFVGCGEG